MEMEEEEEIGIPEWVVTFGDMMSLLLTFFIMLVSLSEIKEEETYQALVDSMQQQFGYQKTIDALTPGKSKPRQSEYAVLSTTGRAKKKDTAKGGVPEKAPVGEEQHVRIIRPGQITAVGSVVFFEVGSDRLSTEAQNTLRETAKQLRGKPQRIEVRGHVSAEFASRTGGTDEAMLLAIRRSGAVKRYLTEVEGLSPDRFRVSSAEATEPMSRTNQGGKYGNDSRVEVFMLDETIEDPRGFSENGVTNSKR
ncbi:chemotaxis protein MotB [Neorhodopirellula lusitana]|uniref:Chemotaxis protein MotB n=1 Tax=Neorhodopirellula lusitana TaxID=445327 RepID=A0ABY1QPA0_9BACT|nr:OmpA family protein [Neorhodopirellula lusitana]SMP76983.1 chemotaxis protein MotB [Neorhodopirellula lusitana]